MWPDEGWNVGTLERWNVPVAIAHTQPAAWPMTANIRPDSRFKSPAFLSKMGSFRKTTRLTCRCPSQGSQWQQRIRRVRHSEAADSFSLRGAGAGGALAELAASFLPGRVWVQSRCRPPHIEHMFHYTRNGTEGQGEQVCTPETTPAPGFRYTAPLLPREAS